MDNISSTEEDVSTLGSSSTSSSGSSRSKRRTARGRPSYLFSISKRPRRNVKKRPISSVQLETIGEERETLLGIPMKRRNSDGAVVHDPNRAPKAALTLFLLVCSVGGFHSFSEYRNSQKASSALSKVDKAEDSEDILHSFRGSMNIGHREAVFETASISVPLDGFGKSSSSAQLHKQLEHTVGFLFEPLEEATLVPDELSNLANVFDEKYDPTTNKIFFWHVPRSGSTTIKRISSHCLGLTMASEVGKSEVAKDGGSSDDVLRIVEGLDGVKFANVDMSNPGGIARAKALQIGQSERIDVVSSSYLYDAVKVFDAEHKGFMVAMFRHPIDRAVSLYYNMRRNSQNENTAGKLETVDQYARSSLVENNWMTRFLTNTLSGQLTPGHEEIAREVLRTKCIVGLLRDKTETMRRLEFLLNWKADRSQRRMECQEKLLYWDWPGKNRHEPVLEGSDAWNRLRDQNTFDIRLYEYAEKLFETQGKLFEEFSSIF